MLPAWTLQLARGILAIGLGVTIALTLEHTPAFGLLTFGVYALLAGGVLLLAAMRSPYPGKLHGLVLAQSVATLAAGAIALGTPGGDVRFLALVVGVWALAAGALETLAGVLARTTSPLARDWLIAGALTIVLGIVVLVLPTDFSQSFSGESGAAGTLTSSVILVGILGAWAVLVGVLQSISGITIRAPRSVAAR